MLDFGVFKSLQVTQIYSKYPCAEKRLCENVCWCNTIFTLQCYSISLFLKNLSFTCSSYFSAFYQFLRLQSFTFIFYYILKANFFNHECCRSIHCFPKLYIKSVSTCPRINLVNPVSNQDLFILEDQRLITNFHGKQIGTPSGTVLAILFEQIFCLIFFA